DNSQVPTDSLESIRNRLNQAHLSLRKLAEQINHHNRHPTKVKLPNYAHFQNQFQILITQLHSIASNLSNNDELLTITNVYPLPNFPTTQQEGLVTTLLRKKVLPEVEDWINKALTENPGVDNDEFAQWCYSRVQELRDDFQFYGFHTVDELDHLETDEGKKETAEKDRLEKEREAKEAAITGGEKGLSPNQVQKFMCQGV
ncbi:uncharacterized protein CANTADRAFT_36829, partial [Suhomyces tanzawaensis NRRL Y-17324]